jgi:hypothetical protein
MVTIAWDLDDVLNGLMREWFESAWLPQHPSCRMAYGDLVENPPHRVLGISEAKYLSSLDAFRLSDGARRMTPNREVLDWLRDYGGSVRSLVLTARPLPSAGLAAEWLFRHFGGYIRTFSVVPMRLAEGLPALDSTKREFLQWIGKVDVLVDDSAANCADACAVGVRAVLYPQPWNGSRATVAETLEQLRAVCFDGPANAVPSRSDD